MSEENNKSFCLKCKQNVDIKDVEFKTTKNNRRMMSGVCIQCNTRTCKFLKKEQVDNKVDEVVKEDEVKVENVKELIQHIENKIVKKVKGNKNKNKEILVE